MAEEKSRLGWGHINLNVSNLERSIAFYRKLGFEVFLPAIPYLGLTDATESQAVPSPSATALGLADGTRGRACIMQLDDGFPKLDLTEFRDLDARAPLTSRDTGFVRICLASQDLKADVARLKAEGVTFLSEPQTGHADLADIAVCLDPDGTHIELLQVYLDRWASVLTPAK